MAGTNNCGRIQQFSSSMANMRWWFIPIVCVILVGCGSRGDRPELGTVTGRVTLNGEPLRNVEVSFVPASGRPSYGETNDDGIYELVYIRDVKGAKVGKHKVTVHSGKVDSSRLPPVDVEPGSNRIDLPCIASGKDQSSTSDDER